MTREVPQAKATGKLEATPPPVSDIATAAAVAGLMADDKVGGLDDRVIVSEVILSTPAGGYVRFASGDKDVINGLYEMATGVRNPGTPVVTPFTVLVAGRVMEVIPLRPPKPTK